MARMSVRDGSQLPKCPNCGAALEYRIINVARPFGCPACQSELVVSDDYSRRVRFVCFAITVFFCALLALRNLLLAVFAPIVFFFVVMFVTIIAKRTFQPPIEDVLGRSKEARYTAL
jgi:uncharacterized C2H2 Zn-finger protein